jgi:hypothetical protein
MPGGVAADLAPANLGAAESNGRRGSGRVRHEEKITVYVSAEELLALEQARLTLRARHSMAVDDLEANAGESELVRRLSAS